MKLSSAGANTTEVAASWTQQRDIEKNENSLMPNRSASIRLMLLLGSLLCAIVLIVGVQVQPLETRYKADSTDRKEYCDFILPQLKSIHRIPDSFPECRGPIEIFGDLFIYQVAIGSRVGIGRPWSFWRRQPINRILLMSNRPNQSASHLPSDFIGYKSTPPTGSKQ